jgi:SAM-dependent methyltransferase
VTSATLDVSDLFPPLEEELGPYLHLFAGNVLNAGAGDRDLRGLVPGRVFNQDIPEGLHSVDIDILAPLDAIPVQDGFFDAILCNAVLEHVADPEAVMAELCRVCRAGGLLYLAVPFMQPEHKDPGDYQRYTADGLAGLAMRHGFEVREVGGIHSVYTTLGWIVREWLMADDRASYRAARQILFPVLRRKARRSRQHVHSLASAYRVVAVRAGAPA